MLARVITVVDVIVDLDKLRT